MLEEVVNFSLGWYQQPTARHLSYTLLKYYKHYSVVTTCGEQQVQMVFRDRSELAEVITNNFNISLSQCSVFICLKTSTIVPLPKQTTITGLNDHTSVALTPIIIKCLKRLVLKYIKAALLITLDPRQYAYRTNRNSSIFVLAPFLSSSLYIYIQ